MNPREWLDPTWWRSMPAWRRVLLGAAWLGLVLCLLGMMVIAIYSLLEMVPRSA